MGLTWSTSVFFPRVKAKKPFASWLSYPFSRCPFLCDSRTVRVSAFPAPATAGLGAACPAWKFQSLTETSPLASDELQELCRLIDLKSRTGKQNKKQFIQLLRLLHQPLRLVCVALGTSVSAPLRLSKCNAVLQRMRRKNAFEVHRVSVPQTDLLCIAFLLLIPQDCCITSINKIYSQK